MMKPGWGCLNGEELCVEVSAKTGIGQDQSQGKLNTCFEGVVLPNTCLKPRQDK